MSSVIIELISEVLISAPPALATAQSTLAVVRVLLDILLSATAKAAGVSVSNP